MSNDSNEVTKKNKKKLFKANNNDNRTKSIDVLAVSLLLTLNRFNTLL